jgi:hypothetical protein
MHTTTWWISSINWDLPHLLPAIFAPNPRVLPTAKVGDVLHNSIESSTEQLCILVVHRDYDEELGLARWHAVVLTQTETGGWESVGVSRDRSVPA